MWITHLNPNFYWNPASVIFDIKGHDCEVSVISYYGNDIFPRKYTAKNVRKEDTGDIKIKFVQNIIYYGRYYSGSNHFEFTIHKLDSSGNESGILYDDAALDVVDGELIPALHEYNYLAYI